ncbi:MAG: aa3-type cytochrome c oxidase subunit IV [Rubrimonas sp.]
MAEHKHGSMDITEQQKTFAGFVRLAGIAIAVVVAVLLLLTFRI